VSIDYAEVERQFLATLQEDSGRSLDEWMAAIAAERLTHRNHIIDWLRRQGFMFSKASWLERIHNNGGRPIYQGAAGPQRRAAPRQPRRAVIPTPVAVEPPPLIEPAPPEPPAPAVPAALSLAALPAVEQPGTAAALDALIAKAKAFRPLAAYVIGEIRKAVPGTVATPHDGFVVFGLGAAAFAVLAISPKELRLGLAATTSPGPPWEAAKLGLRGAPATSHMIVLTDARQVTPLLAAVARAAAG
jgi:hypothetical protein